MVTAEARKDEILRCRAGRRGRLHRQAVHARDARREAAPSVADSPLPLPAAGEVGVSGDRSTLTAARPSPAGARAE